MRALPTAVVDALLAVLFCAFELAGLSSLAAAAAQDPELLSSPAPALTPGLVGLVVAVHLPLLWRQRRPLLVGAAVLVGTLVAQLGFGLLLAAWGICAALYEVAARQKRRISALVLALVLVVQLSVYQFAFLNGNEPGDAVITALYNAAVFGTAWGLGYWSRVRRERVAGLERTREARAREAVASERARVARELHDILAHSISVMVVQAGGAREVLPPGADQAAEALRQIERTGRQGMVEVRRLLGLLRADAPAGGAAQPGLERLAELVAEVRDAGLPVTVRAEGTPQPLDPSVDLSAYRIAQEALTNVLKHARGAHAVTILTAWTAGALRLEICDDGPGPASSNGSPGGGNGLLGMRERAALLGGSLHAGPRDGGGFRVVATLPTAVPAVQGPPAAASAQAPGVGAAGQAVGAPVSAGRE